MGKKRFRRDSKQVRRYVLGAVDWCYLCGYPIPDSIASPTHRLYGTVDHVVPLARGGTNELSNRRAAHLYCNQHKKSRYAHSIDWRHLQTMVIRELQKIDYPFRPKMHTDAKQRIAELMSMIPVKRSTRLPFWLDTWENEGGALHD